MTTQFKIGDFLVVTRANKVVGNFKEGVPYEVVGIDEDDNTPFVRLPNGQEVGFFDHEMQFVEKSKSRLTKRQLIAQLQVEFASFRNQITDRLDEQDSIIAEQGAEIKKLKEAIKAQSVNERKEIIQKAMNFVAENLKDTEIIFEVDSKTKTVLAKKLTKSFGSYFATATASAVCGRHDIYNQYLGQAIALGRLLGLDTSEFEDCAQPKDYTEGQIVSIANVFEERHIGEIKKINGDELWVEVEGRMGFVYKNAEQRYNTKGLNPVIVDDTEAKY